MNDYYTPTETEEEENNPYDSFNDEEEENEEEEENNENIGSRIASLQNDVIRIRHDFGGFQNGI